MSTVLGQRFFRNKHDCHIHISQKSLVKFLNKSTSLQTLSLGWVKLSDMVSPPWDVYNVASPNCILLYYMYRMWRLLLGISVELSSNLRTSQMWHCGGAVMNSLEEWLKDCGGNRPLNTKCLLHQVNLLYSHSLVDLWSTCVHWHRYFWAVTIMSVLISTI